MAPHSSTLAWKIPWMEEPGRLQSMGSLRVGYDRATSLSLFTFMHWRRKWQPTPVFLPGEFQGRGAWWAAVCGVAYSRTRLKWLTNYSTPLSMADFRVLDKIRFTNLKGLRLRADPGYIHPIPPWEMSRQPTYWVSSDQLRCMWNI